MMPKSINWRTLHGPERHALQARLSAAPCHFVGGSLHVDEYHVVLDDTVYRFFAAQGDPAAITADTEVEVSWEVEVPEVQMADVERRARHMEICRAGDRFAQVVGEIGAPAEVLQELVTQIVAMQRVAMVLNSPGKTLSPSKLNRF